MRDSALGLTESDEFFLSFADNCDTKRGVGSILAFKHLISRKRSIHTSPKRVTDMLPPLRRPVPLTLTPHVVLFLDREGLTTLGSPVAMDSKEGIV